MTVEQLAELAGLSGTNEKCNNKNIKPMSRTAKQHEALQKANKTIHILTGQNQVKDKQLLSCVEIIDQQQVLIKKLQRPVRWFQVWK